MPHSLALRRTISGIQRQQPQISNVPVLRFETSTIEDYISVELLWYNYSRASNLHFLTDLQLVVKTKP